MLGIKQEALAVMLNEDWTQINISRLEQKETIDAQLLQQISDALKIPVEAIQNFDEEQAVNIISSTIHNHDQSAFIQYNPTFNINPIEESRKLHDEKMELYEMMLKEKMMERLIKKK